MSKVERIQAEIESLSDEEYSRLRQWFSERDWEKWDRQVEADSESGKLDFLVKEALDEKSKGTLMKKEGSGRNFQHSMKTGRAPDMGQKTGIKPAF
jgi:hypothetical protein